MAARIDHAVTAGNRVTIEPTSDTAAGHASFLVLHDGRIQFEGNGADLLASRDPYLREFLFLTLPPW